MYRITLTILSIVILALFLVFYFKDRSEYNARQKAYQDAKDSFTARGYPADKIIMPDDYSPLEEMAIYQDSMNEVFIKDSLNDLK